MICEVMLLLGCTTLNGYRKCSTAEVSAPGLYTTLLTLDSLVLGASRGGADTSLVLDAVGWGICGPCAGD